MEEEWEFLGKSGSDAESADAGDDDKGSESSFTMVQIGRSSLAKADGGKNRDEEEEEESDGDGEDDYFDLGLPALAGSKAVFGASGNSFNLDLAASILSMGSIGYAAGAEADAVSLCSEDGVGPELLVCDCVHCANIDNYQSSEAAELVSYDDIDTGSSDSWESDYDDDDDEHFDAVETDEPHKPFVDPLWQAALDDYHEDQAQQLRLAAMAPPPWRQQRPPGAPHLFFDVEESDYDDDDDDECSDATEIEEPRKPFVDPLWAAALDDYNEDCAQQLRLAAMAPPPWRQQRPPGAPHLFFNVEESDAISKFVSIAKTSADALALFDAMESALELPFDDHSSRSDWKAALDKAREDYKVSNAAESNNGDVTESYSDAEESNDDEESETSDAAEESDSDYGDDTVTSYTSLAHRGAVISDFVGTVMTRADALVRFKMMESAMELPQYNLSRSDVDAWKTALGKGREDVAARQRRLALSRPLCVPHLY